MKHKLQAIKSNETAGDRCLGVLYVFPERPEVDHSNGATACGNICWHDVGHARGVEGRKRVQKAHILFKHNRSLLAPLKVRVPCLQEGRQAVPMDITYSDACDILTPTGFCNALYMTLQLQPGTACFTAPVCSTWVYMRPAMQDNSHQPGNLLQSVKLKVGSASDTCNQACIQVTGQYRPDAGLPVGLAEVLLGAGCKPHGGPSHGVACCGHGFEGLVGAGTARGQFTGMPSVVPGGAADEGPRGSAESGLYAALRWKDFEADLVVQQPLPTV